LVRRTGLQVARVQSIQLQTIEVRGLALAQPQNGNAGTVNTSMD